MVGKAARASRLSQASTVSEADSLVTAAIQAQEQGRLRDSAALLERALRADPDDVEALCRYAMLALQAGRPDVALPVAQRAASSHGSSPIVQNLLGVVLRQNGRLADAIERLQSAVSLDPEFGDARINLGNALIDAGEPQRALPHYQKALALDPASASAHNNLRNLYRELRRPSEAIASSMKSAAFSRTSSRRSSRERSSVGRSEGIGATFAAGASSGTAWLSNSTADSPCKQKNPSVQPSVFRVATDKESRAAWRSHRTLRTNG